MSYIDKMLLLHDIYRIEADTRRNGDNVDTFIEWCEGLPSALYVGDIIMYDFDNILRYLGLYDLMKNFSKEYVKSFIIELIYADISLIVSKCEDLED